MGNLYYKIWTDAIVFERSKHGHLRNWKIFTLIPITVLQGINLLTVFLWLSALNIKIDIFIEFNIFPGTMLDSFASAAVTLFLPFLIINYFLILRGKRFQLLIKKYGYKNGRLYLFYFIATISIFIIPLIVGKFIL